MAKPKDGAANGRDTGEIPNWKIMENRVETRCRRLGTGNVGGSSYAGPF
jgi:hypothetical protein